MKKSLLAVAAIGAFASAAQAQSSVTVYGILDVGYVGYNTRVAPGGKDAVAKNTSNQFNGGSESTNRLGFKGTEDLGGGSSAFFTVELGLDPVASTSGFKNSATTENRQAFAGLKKNGLGDFAIGTQYTLVHNAVAATDAGGTNNILGDMIYTSSTPTTSSGDAFAAGQSYTIRAQQALTLNSATFAGFTGHGLIIMNNKNTNQTQIAPNASGNGGYTGGTNNQNGWGLGADYAWKGLFVTAAYQALSAKTQYDASTITPASTTAQAITAFGITQFGAGQASTLGSNIKDNQIYAAATYDFGILKAYAQYLNRKMTAQQDSGFYAKRTGEQIGVRSFITPTIEAWAQGGLGKYTSYGSSNPAANMTSWQVGSNYYLSKRTNLYAIYGQVGTSNVSVVANQNPVSANASNYAVGIRHTF